VSYVLEAAIGSDEVVLREGTKRLNVGCVLVEGGIGSPGALGWCAVAERPRQNIAQCERGLRAIVDVFFLRLKMSTR